MCTCRGSRPREAHPKLTLSSVTVHDALPARRTAIAAFFVALHALSISYAVSTAGQPYLAALEQQWKIGNATNASLDNATNASTSAGDAVADAAAAAAEAPASDAEAAGAAAQKPAVDGGFGDEWDDPWAARAVRRNGTPCTY